MVCQILILLIQIRLMGLMMDLERQGILDRQELPYRLVALALEATGLQNCNQIGFVNIVF